MSEPLVEVYSAPGRSPRARILAFIHVTRAITGLAPSYPEIANGLNMGVTTVFHHISMLRREGAIAERPYRNANRVFQPTSEPLAVIVLEQEAAS